ncbi:MAG: cation-translocating P-type ATPase [Chlamydiota bacterium]|nr:cation-translocating P-type ATPase [Chlamydiota bacterium]
MKKSIEKINFKVFGLDCAEEVSILKNLLGDKEGVKDLEFNILNSKMSVILDPEKINSEAVIELVFSVGMNAIPWEERTLKLKNKFYEQYKREILTSLSGLFLIFGFVYHYYQHPNILDILGYYEEKTPHTMAIPTIFFYLLSAAFSIWHVLPKAWRSLRRLQPDMYMLMVIAVSGAIAIGEFFEAATVSFLFSSALLLESWSVDRVRRAVSSLMDLSPPQARVIIPGSKNLQVKRVENIDVGSVILIKPGERIPLDCVILKGSSYVNQSPITGESMPVYKEPESQVFAGTINGDGTLECRVQKKSEDTTLARMIHLVQEAQSKQAKTEQWVEKFARIYTPSMLFFALLVLLIPPLMLQQPWQEWVYRSLVLLVVACPCALVLSTPVSIVSALTSALRNGVLIKGGKYLEAIGRIKAIALDKTGTLTYGQPEVKKMIPLNNHTERELLERAASLEYSSEHALAKAILDRAKADKIEFTPAEDYQIFKGKGAEGKIKGKRYWIGSHRYMHEMKLETEDVHQLACDMEDAGHTIISIGSDSHICGLISVADKPRESINQTVKELKQLGIDKVVMLTGDNKQTAKSLADLSGVDEYYAELLPEEKVEIMNKLSEEYFETAMVGDGVNDAPALSIATVGIAMGGIGTDVSLEAADIVLVSDEVAKIPWCIKLSRRTLKVIKQNIIFSLGLKALFILLVFFGISTLWMAIAADTGASIIVIFNGLKLLNQKADF